MTQAPAPHHDRRLQARFQIARGNFSLDVALDLPGHGVSALFGPSGCG